MVQVVFGVWVLGFFEWVIEINELGAGGFLGGCRDGDEAGRFWLFA